MKRLGRLYRISRTAGAAVAVDWVKIKLNRSDTVRSIHPVGAVYPLWARTRSSDLGVFRQIFLEREYACLNLTDGDLILDLGANVGYAAAYFLSRYPASSVTAVEPDPGNFAMLQRNLEPYRSRATVVEGAVWSHVTTVSMRAEQYRGGSACTRQVEERKRGDVAAFDIPSLLALSPRRRIGLLKMDVEGAEVAIFGGKCPWLDQVDRIAIELHDDSVFGNATEVFYNAIRDHNFEISRSGELTICSRRTNGA